MKRFFSQLIIISFCFFIFSVFTSDLRAEDLNLQTFSTLYEQSFEEISVTPKVPNYEFPLDQNDIVNYRMIQSFTEQNYWSFDRTGLILIYPLGGDIMEVLLDQGIVAAHFFIDSPEFPSIVKVYQQLKERNIPILITSDSLLHLYHVQFDETLLEIESREFYPSLLSFTQAMLSEAKSQYQSKTGDLKEAARRNEAFFTVALKLLDPTVTIPASSYIQQEVDYILSRINSHSGFSSDPIFKYKEDYSQYVPRGHYTRSETLKKYFKAMMWYGRMTFLLKGSDNSGSTESNNAFISGEDALIQTLQAALIASTMKKVTIADKTLFDIWWRIYMVTSFYVGISDDLSPADYLTSLKSAFNGQPIDMEALANNENLFLHFKAQLALLPSPKIYGGTGQATVLDISDPSLTPELLNDCLDKTKGMRLMGQRYTPDSYIMGQMVFPSVNLLQGQSCFTTSITPLGAVRGFPRGLDVMAVLGSERAEKILKSFGDTNYEGYNTQFEAVKGQFEKFDAHEWNKNLYWSWLSCLKALLERPGKGYPAFMQTDVWQDKQLNTALASWTELRHDTMLYAKQSATSGSVSGPSQARVVGYVEPLPEFYSRLLTLTRMTNQGLSMMGCLNNSAQTRLASLESILQDLLDISVKELNNEALSDQDYDFINDFGDHLEEVVLDIPEQGLDHRLVADVHTDISSNQVLEEAVGNLDLLLAAYKVPDGRIIIGAGPVFSYYEFKQPMANRLTDETWRKQIYSTERPPWIYSFCLDKDNMDCRESLPYSLSLKGDEATEKKAAVSSVPFYPFYLAASSMYQYPFSFSYPSYLFTDLNNSNYPGSYKDISSFNPFNPFNPFFNGPSDSLFKSTQYTPFVPFLQPSYSTEGLYPYYWYYYIMPPYNQ